MYMPIIARIIYEMNILTFIEGISNTQQYTLRKGLIKFGKYSENAGVKKMRQLHDHTCFKPISIAELTESKIKNMEAILLLQEKRDKTVNAVVFIIENPHDIH